MDTWSFVFSGCFFEGPLGHGNHSIYNWLPTLGCLASKLGALYPYSSQWNQGTGGQTYMHFEKWTSLKTQRVNLPSKLYKGVDLPINKKSSTNQPTNLLYIYIYVSMCTTVPPSRQDITDTLPRHSNDFRSPLLWRRRQRWSTKRWEAHRPKSNPFKERQVGSW